MNDKKPIKFKLLFINGDEVVYTSTSNDIRYARTEIVPDKYLEIEGVWYNTNQILAFVIIRE